MTEIIIQEPAPWPCYKPRLYRIKTLVDGNDLTLRSIGDGILEINMRDVTWNFELGSDIIIKEAAPSQPLVEPRS